MFCRLAAIARLTRLVKAVATRNRRADGTVQWAPTIYMYQPYFFRVFMDTIHRIV